MDAHGHINISTSMKMNRLMSVGTSTGTIHADIDKDTCVNSLMYLYMLDGSGGFVSGG